MNPELRAVPGPWRLTGNDERSAALARLDRGQAGRAAALEALERQLRLLAEIGSPDWGALPESLQEHFGFFLDDLARDVPTLSEATPERFTELFAQRGYTPDEVAAAGLVRSAFLYAVLSRGADAAARFLLSEADPDDADRVAAVVREHAATMPPELAATLVQLLRLDLGERAIPALEAVAGDPMVHPAAANMARAMLRELGHGPPMRAVLALDHAPGADPLRSWLQQALDAPDHTLYDAAEALERGGSQDFVFHGPYGVEYPFGVRVTEAGAGTRLVIEFPPDADPPGDWLADLVTSAGRMLRADVGVAAPGADLERELAAATAPRGPHDVPPVLWTSMRYAPRFADAQELARSAQIQSDGSTLLLGR